MFSCDLQPCWVSFDENQADYDLNLGINHQCGRLYELEFLERASSELDPYCEELDPITNNPYSIHFDACLFVVKEKCICKLMFPLPYLTPMPLCMADSEECSVVGFPGFLHKNSASLKSFSEIELDLVKKAMQEGVITKSSGSILQGETLYAINCPTIPGFSGAPVMASNENGEWQAWGIFLGGPSVPLHRKLIEIGYMYNMNRAGTRMLIDSLDFNMYRIIKERLIEAFNHYSVYGFITTIKTMHEEALLDAINAGIFSRACLNHNLCLPLQRIMGFLNHFEISYPTL